MVVPPPPPAADVNASSADSASGGGIDVPLRAVAGADGGEVPAAAEVPVRISDDVDRRFRRKWSELAERREGEPGVALRDRREAARIDVPDPFAIYRHYPTALLGPNTVVAVKSADLAADLARLREGKLNVHDAMAHAFLPRPAVDALLARLAAEPATAEDLAANHRGDRRQLLRTLLWLRKFDLVEFRGLQTANRPSDSMLRKP